MTIIQQPQQASATPEIADTAARDTSLQDDSKSRIDIAKNDKNSPSEAAQKSFTYEWYVVSICMVAYIFSFVDRQILALMIEPIKRDLGLSDIQFSLLHGLAFSLFYAFMGMPIAMLADKFSRPKIIAIGVGFWSLATALCGTSKNFLQMFLARMGVGVGEAALSPATYSMLSDMFPKEKLGRAVAIYSIGSFIGGGVAFLIGGYVIDLLKNVGTVAVPVLGQMRAWQVTFFIVGLPGLAVALLIFLTIRDPQRKGLKRDASGQARKASLESTLKFLAQHPETFFCHYLGFSAYAMALYCMLSWAPAFYMRKFGMTPSEAGYTLGIIVLLANTSGVLFSGWLIDKLSKMGRTDAPLRAGVIGAVGLLLPGIFFSQVDELWLSLVLLAPTMFFVSFPLSTSTAAMQILAPNQMRAQVSAIFLLVSNLIAVGFGTTLVAMLTDTVFKSPAMVGSSMSIVNGASTLATLILLGIGCRYYRESLKREGIN